VVFNLFVNFFWLLLLRMLWFKYMYLHHLGLICNAKLAAWARISYVLNSHRYISLYSNSLRQALSYLISPNWAAVSEADVAGYSKMETVGCSTPFSANARTVSASVHNKKQKTDARMHLEDQPGLLTRRCRSGPREVCARPYHCQSLIDDDGKEQNVISKLEHQLSGFGA
jgi:hypothetical protein